MTKHIFPESLFGRLMAALLGVVGGSLLIVALLVAHERRELAFRGSEAAEVVELIAATTRKLAEMPAESRPAALRDVEMELLRRSGQASPARMATASPKPPAELADAARQLQARVEQAIGRGFRIDAGPVEPGADNVVFIASEAAGAPRFFLHTVSRDPPSPPTEAPDLDTSTSSPSAAPPTTGEVSTDSDEPRAPPTARRMRFLGGPVVDLTVGLPDSDTLTFRTALPRPAAPLPTQIFVQLALLTAVLGIVLYGMTRTITRPLSELAEAAEAVGSGARRRPPLRETGAREIREATRAFNIMQERLHRYLDSRIRVVAAMSHDLRTPLTRLRLRVESIGDTRLRQRFTADLDEMTEMVNGALSLFRGLNDNEPARPIDVGALLDELRRDFAETGGDVSIDGRAEHPLVAKPHALKRCLTNLLTNAVTYGSKATIAVEQRDADLVIRVLDQGPGIPEDALEQVFEPFFRLEGSRNAATGGTGLGLSIARDIAQLHGGSLELHNRSPRGVEAVLRLPSAEPRGH
jgi:signal transduction histidine kinase